jgi:hypothetical protein
MDLALPTNPNTTSAITTAVDDTHMSLPNRRDSANNAESFSSPYCVGDQVEITNKVRRLFNRTPTRRDRIGTITKVSDKKIEFITENDTSTWRAPHNLKKLDQL